MTMNATEREALLPCPFCSGKPVMDGKSDYCRIRCEGCGTEGQSHGFDGENDDDMEAAEGLAIAAWNRRASAERASAEKDAARLLAKLIADMDEGHRRQIGSPHHAHSIAGIWDSDNGVRAGKPCEQCAMWNEARALVAAMNAEPTK